MNGTGGKILQERSGYRGGEIEVEGVVERSGSVGEDALHIGRRGLEEVDGGNVVNGIAILIKEKVEGDAMLTQVLDVDQRRQYILAEPIVDQDLVDLLVRRSGCAAHGLVQIQHPNYTLCNSVHKISIPPHSNQSNSAS